MRDRWLPVGTLAAALFAINVVARLVARFGFDGDDDMQGWVTLTMLAVTGLILAAVAFHQGQRHPVGRWSADAAVVIVAATVAAVLIGPFVSGNHPFVNGVGAFFSQIWWYGGFSAGGTLIGYLLSVALGLDHRSRSLKQYAETVRAKPPRPVRR
ncbi:MAG TPA: hypothetical protein VF174_05610 [Micromonosporaceae bacterium]